MMKPISGGCACGRIKYRCSSKPLFSFHCPCRDCQQASGTGHSSVFICRDDDTEIDGELSWYKRVAPSNNTVKQGFCGNCGSPIMNRNSGYPDNLFITAGSLDDPSLFAPTKTVHPEMALAWDFQEPEEPN